MNHNANINPVPVHSAHTHFYDYFESFPGLHADESFANKRVSNLDKLRQQYVSQEQADQNLCFRNCFKFQERRYTEFCLERKCGETTFLQAAQRLGLLKN